MTPASRKNRSSWLGGSILLAAGAFVAGAASLRPHHPQVQIETAGLASHLTGWIHVGEPTTVPGFMYLGNSSCMGSGCHSAETPTEQSGQMIGDEYNVWSSKDPHHRAYDTLFTDASKAMAAKVAIEDAPTSARCISCHTTAVPEPQRGERFSVDNAVGCESCHGPGEKYLDPHVAPGWTAAQRKEKGSAALRTEFGLIDTTDLAIRAQGCVACHLQIDKDLLDAGHPPLQFEMYAYNYYCYDPKSDYDFHWDDSGIEWINAKLWAIGQVASWEASKQQVLKWQGRGWDTTIAEALAKMYGAGASIASRHFGANTASGLLSGAYNADACKAAAMDLAALAASADSTIARKNIAFGLTALCQAWFTAKGHEVPDAFWDSYDVAVEGRLDDDWNKAIEAMLKSIDP